MVDRDRSSMRLQRGAAGEVDQSGVHRPDESSRRRGKYSPPSRPPTRGCGNIDGSCYLRFMVNSICTKNKNDYISFRSKSACLFLTRN